jgi:N-[(2S)-2-amino-2-carboxyethyl]-L-glutamate dehydrogenase
MPTFDVVSGESIAGILAEDPGIALDIVEQAYRLHGEGATVNPRSYFLRFPEQPRNRIIALPAAIGGPFEVSGIKWIASYPQNVDSGIPRASAVLVLNDTSTGYPFACLEGSIISAVRTAASAVLAADYLGGRTRRCGRLGFVGNGLIARYIHDFFCHAGWNIGGIELFDLRRAEAERFARDVCARRAPAREIRVHDRVEDLVAASDIVVFATVAGAPYLGDPALFAHRPLVLHVSLRDLAPEVVLACNNVVDDVDHCLTASTSLHLAEQRVGHRSFVAGTLYDSIVGSLTLDAARATVFSPFGLGILDLALGQRLHEEAVARGEARRIDDFFFDLER